MDELTPKQLGDIKHFVLYFILHYNELKTLFFDHLKKKMTVTQVMVILRYSDHSKTSAFLTNGFKYGLFNRKRKGQKVYYSVNTVAMMDAFNGINAINERKV